MRDALLDGDVVVAVVDPAVGDGDVGGGAGVDAVGVAGVVVGADEFLVDGGLQVDAPGGEAVGAAYGDVVVGRVVAGGCGRA